MKLVPTLVWQMVTTGTEGKVLPAGKIFTLLDQSVQTEAVEAPV